MTGAIEARGLRVDDFNLKSILCRQYDYALFHWPEGFATEPKTTARALFRSISLLATLFYLKCRGTALYWMAHDIEPLRQKRAWLAHRLMRAFIRQLDGVFFLSPVTRDLASSKWPALTHNQFVVAHGLLGEQYDREPPDWAPAFDTFCGQRKVLGYLGDIKTYKNPKLIAELVRNLPDDWIVLVAGRPDADPEVLDAVAELKTLRSTNRVFVSPERIPHNNLQWIVQRVDAVLLPYSWGWNTGFGHLALEFGTPILGSNVPGLIGVKQQYPDAPVWLCDDSHAYIETLQHLNGVKEGRWHSEFINRNQWSEVASTLIGAMQAWRG
jgi:glycosyltransferase involved in cell wall biosynthesis